MFAQCGMGPFADRLTMPEDDDFELDGVGDDPEREQFEEEEHADE